MDNNKKIIEVFVSVEGTEKYYVEADNLEEAKKILNEGDSDKYKLIEQDLEFIRERFYEN